MDLSSVCKTGWTLVYSGSVLYGHQLTLAEKYQSLKEYGQMTKKKIKKWNVGLSEYSSALFTVNEEQEGKRNRHKEQICLLVRRQGD